MRSRSGLAATGVLVSLLADGGGLRAGPGRRTGPQEEPRHSDVTGVGAVRSCAVPDARRRLRGNDVRPRANITGVRVVRGNLSASVPAKGNLEANAMSVATATPPGCDRRWPSSPRRQSGFDGDGPAISCRKILLITSPWKTHGHGDFEHFLLERTHYNVPSQKLALCDTAYSFSKLHFGTSTSSNSVFENTSMFLDIFTLSLEKRQTHFGHKVTESSTNYHARRRGPERITVQNQFVQFAKTMSQIEINSLLLY